MVKSPVFGPGQFSARIEQVDFFRKSKQPEICAVKNYAKVIKHSNDHEVALGCITNSDLNMWFKQWKNEKNCDLNMKVDFFNYKVNFSTSSRYFLNKIISIRIFKNSQKWNHLSHWLDSGRSFYK